MSARVTLTKAQREQIARGMFVRVALAGQASLLVGKVGGAWRAYANVCKHRALPLDLGAKSPMSDDGEYLLCNQHGALYRRSDGLCILGPCAGESLAAIDVAEQGAELVVGAAAACSEENR
jgi:nitrite reductase/ring-hydroxylating ferredoxin subunit